VSRPARAERADVASAAALHAVQTRVVALVLGTGTVLSLGLPFLHDHTVSAHADVAVSGWNVIIRDLPSGTQGPVLIHVMPVAVVLVAVGSAVTLTRRSIGTAVLWAAVVLHVAVIVGLLFDFGAARSMVVGHDIDSAPSLHSPTGPGVGLWTTVLLGVGWLGFTVSRLRDRRMWA
jgi:hypothetical protein